MRKILCLVSSVGVLLATHGAFAQTDQERATARDAANNGRAAYDAGKYEKAIDYLSRAEQLVHAPTHLLFIARAQVKLGRLVAAHETYLKITRETLASNAPKAFVSAQASAEQEQESVDERLPTVTVVLQGVTTAPDISVQMDGTPLPPAMIGIPLPADPGEHAFKATGPTIDSDPVTIKLSEGAKQTVTLKLRSNGVTLPPAAGTTPGAAANSNQNPNAAAAGGAAAHGNADESAPRYVNPEPTSASHGTGLFIASGVSFALGLASASIGTYYMIAANDTRNESDSLYEKCKLANTMGTGTCVDEDMRNEILAKDNDADHQSKLGIVGLVGGGVGVAAGVTFLIVGLNQRKSTAQLTPHIAPVFGFRSVGVVGTF